MVAAYSKNQAPVPKFIGQPVGDIGRSTIPAFNNNLRASLQFPSLQSDKFSQNKPTNTATGPRGPQLAKPQPLQKHTAMNNFEEEVDEQIYKQTEENRRLKAEIEEVSKLVEVLQRAQKNAETMSVKLDKFNKNTSSTSSKYSSGLQNIS